MELAGQWVIIVGKEPYGGVIGTFPTKKEAKAYAEKNFAEWKKNDLDYVLKVINKPNVEAKDAGAKPA